MGYFLLKAPFEFFQAYFLRVSSEEIYPSAGIALRLRVVDLPPVDRAYSLDQGSSTALAGISLVWSMRFFKLL